MASYLQELIHRLEREDPELVLPIGWARPHSYRGYYSELGVEQVENVSVADCLAVLREALGSTYTGWKGGEYKMNVYTEVYLAEEGDTGDQLTPTLLELDIRLAKSLKGA